jgi:hypothetical protein
VRHLDFELVDLDFAREEVSNGLILLDRSVSFAFSE